MCLNVNNGQTRIQTFLLECDDAMTLSSVGILYVGSGAKKSKEGWENKRSAGCNNFRLASRANDDQTGERRGMSMRFS